MSKLVWCEKCCSLEQGFNLSRKPLKNWGHEMALQRAKCPGKNGRNMWRWEKWADGGGKRWVRAIEAPLLETISLFPVNTLLTRTTSSCRLQHNKKIAIKNFWIFQILAAMKMFMSPPWADYSSAYPLPQCRYFSSLKIRASSCVGVKYNKYDDIRPGCPNCVCLSVCVPYLCPAPTQPS